MSQSTTSGIDENSSPPKKQLGVFRPYFYTIFQSSCSGVKSNVSTSTPNKELLPIPTRFKERAEQILAPFNQWIIEDLPKIASFNSIIPNVFLEKTDEFQLEKYLVDRTMLRMLQDADIINWNYRLKRLFPIRTSGNGNCLLHAVLIAMVGVHDISLHLRDQLREFMTANQDVLKNHWRIERLKSDKSYGITTEDAKLDDEWKELCDLVHYENTEDGQAATHLEFLESVHIFSLSNMLRRPIIILSEDVIRNKDGEPISVNDLYGIYLPILSIPQECVNQPIVLAYDRSHFCPLQTSDSNLDALGENLLPLYPAKNHVLEQTLLPIRFLGEDVTPERSNNLIREYLQIKEIDYIFSTGSTPLTLQCAELGNRYVPIKQSFFLLYYDYLNDFFKIQKPRAIEEELSRERQREHEEWMTKHASYDIHRSPRDRYDTSPTRLYSTTPRSRIDRYDPITYSSDSFSNDGYIPRNGLSYFANSESLPQRSFQRQSQIDHQYPESPRRQTSSTKPDVLSNLTNSDSKQINSVNIRVNGTNSQLNPERTQPTSIQIPVQVLKPSSSSSLSSNEPNLTIYQPGRLYRDPCALCNEYFDDRYLKRICPLCEAKLEYRSAYSDFVSRPTARSQSTNFYEPSSGRSYASVASPRPRSTYSNRTKCPKCHSLNLSLGGSHNTQIQCSACKYPISSTSTY